MGVTHSSLNKEELKHLQTLCTFTTETIIKLYHRYKQLDKQKTGVISHQDLVAIPELAANPLASRIISVMDISEVNFQSFIKVLNVFSPQTCVIEKLDFAFKIYDVNNDGYVSRSDLFEILSLLIGDNMEEEMIYSLVDTAIKDADTDGDGRISRDEFRCFFKGDDSIVGMMSIEF